MSAVAGAARDGDSHTAAQSHAADFDAAAERFRQRIVAENGIAGGADAPTQQPGTVPVEAVRGRKPG